MKTVVRLRFTSPEPSQLRSNALSGIMNQGDEGYRITFDDVNGIVHLARKDTVRSVPLSACAWVEWASNMPVATLTPENIAASKAQPEAYKKL